MLSGPRLDRPSAVGDEGRPRATSLWIASLVVVVLAWAGGRAVGQPNLPLTLGTVVGGTVAGVGLMNRDRFGPLLVGHLLFFFFGSLLILWLLVTLVVHPAGFVVAGFAVAMVGVGVAWADVATSEWMENTLLGVTITYVSMLVALGVIVAAAGVLLAGGVLVEATTAGTTPGASLAWFLLAATYAAGSLRVLLWGLPVEQLSPRRRRPERAARVRSLGRILLAVAVLAPMAFVAALLGVLLGGFGTLARAAPPAAAALDALGTAWLLGTVAVVGSVALAVAGVATLLRAGTRRFDASNARWAAATAAGVFLAVVLVLFVGWLLIYSALQALLTATVLLVAVNVAPLVLLAVGPVVGFLSVVLGVFPDRAGGPALAAAGLVIATVGFGAGPSWLAFACAAGAVVVWDCSAYGFGLTAELGHLPETRRLELFHAVVVVGVGAVAVVALVGLDALRGALSLPGGPTATLVAGAGVLLLLLPLRG